MDRSVAVPSSEGEVACCISLKTADSGLLACERVTLATIGHQPFGDPGRRSEFRHEGDRELRNSGQSLWLDNITRDLLTSSTLKRYIDTLSVTGLTSNPTIFDHAISKSAAYDQGIRALTRSGVGREDLFFRLAIADL